MFGAGGKTGRYLTERQKEILQFIADYRDRFYLQLLEQIDDQHGAQLRSEAERLRQPFGGVGKSAVGPGIKAGGPNYIAPLMKFKRCRHLTVEDSPRHGTPRRAAWRGRWVA